ncbi:autophagy protein 5 [Thecamonas trahens ATCC 50062]|uniref:Autophagy protein 5 n=1 Tax=Thecamonas trahens ATCC 50062 TaxID=461836 RepID=A0A0L0DKA2_THETB|nr:autophagy protein 5 [Thecamonas trahens ATCC 50062]KNC52486.1 autophagy protein 5 [Thecamonas trahens ATCC 50062]|eukprot:XP_013755283.1 autophagy protein 5 [Thecamonas trahens ATCC 50062]
MWVTAAVKAATGGSAGAAGVDGVWELVVHFTDFPHDAEDDEADTANMMDMTTMVEAEEVKAWYMNRLKEAEYVKHGSSKGIMLMSKANHAQLFRAVATHDYDRYWAVNRTLSADSVASPAKLKHVPLRLAFRNTPTMADLILPIHPTTGELTTLGNALDALLPDKPPGTIVLVHGVELDPDVTLHDLTNSMAYADNFVYVAIAYPPHSLPA